MALDPNHAREYKVPAAKETYIRFVSFSEVPAKDVVQVLEAFGEGGWRSLHILTENQTGCYTVIGEKAHR